MGMNFPNAPTDGTVFAPAGGPTYTFSNGVWKLAGGGTGFVVVSDTAPPTPFPGQLWWESDSGALFFWYVDANSSQWVQINFTPSNSGISSVVTTAITTSGTYTKSASLKFLEVEGVGAGGGAAASNATAAGQNSVSSGGGAGAWGKKLFKASDLAASTPYTVAAGGGTSSSAGGSNGGTSEFGSGINLTLGGGIGGSRTGVVTTFTAVSGGVGGALGSGWDIGIAGENGHTGVAAISGAINLRPAGGSTRFSSPFPDSYFGNAGSIAGGNYGGGAGGAVNSGSQAAQTGNTGGNGMFIFTEYF
jgi:hypothetical protein